MIDGSQLPKDISKRLTILYVVSLSVIAALAIAGQFRVQSLIQEQSTDLEIISVAQRQQLVSQQLVKSVLALAVATDPELRVEESEHLRDVLEEADTLERQLLSLEASTHLSSELRAHVQAMTEDLTHQYEILVATANDTLSLVSALDSDLQEFSLSPEQMEELTSLLRVEKAFIEDMDQIILDYNRQAEIEAEKLRRLEYMLLTVVIIVLAFEGAVVFRPATRKIHEVLSALGIEQQKSESLLLNILPKSIADRLKESSSAIAEGYDEASVLFADIVGFTSLSEKIAPDELVDILNKIFSSFDELVENYELEKIKTIGDAYMVAAGLPNKRADHAEAITLLAFDMQKALERVNQESGYDLDIRIGINSGPVVAGVIGIKKFIYDLWGDTVNTASRMESHGFPGSIQISESTKKHIDSVFELEPLGVKNIKGKGEMPVYRVIAPIS